VYIVVVASPIPVPAQVNVLVETDPLKDAINDREIKEAVTIWKCVGLRDDRDDVGNGLLPTADLKEPQCFPRLINGMNLSEELREGNRKATPHAADIQDPCVGVYRE
jgi:hypothetical protein